jgi:oligopeptide/dipeptide ABC transporter ATP-binding protein
MASNESLGNRAPALELRDVEVVYERRGRERVRAVAGASLTVERGQIVGLVGESGCGKSSLARAAVGLVQPAAGTVVFEGREVTPLTRGARPRELAGLQMVFQNPYSSLNPRRKIGAQLADALDALDLLPRRGRGARVRELLDLVGLPPSAAVRYPHQFSGGQRQRIAVARSLAAEPSVLVLDEPLASLDASAQAQVANLLVELSRRLSLSLLLISHDLAIVRHVADVVSVMYLGVMVETGPTGQLWSLPLHPYTEALIGAVPHPDGRGFLPEALPGEVPDPARPPAACRFHPRCPYAFDRCSKEDPLMLRVAENRTAACWLQTGAGPPARPAEQAGRLPLLRTDD